MPRWKIRRGLFGTVPVWYVFAPNEPDWRVYFRVWENALTYIELREVKR